MLYGDMTLTPCTRMENKKYLSSDVHLTNKIIIDVAQTSPYDFSTSPWGVHLKLRLEIQVSAFYWHTPYNTWP